MDIGFAGAGRMGRPMIRNLVAAGHAVSVFDPYVDVATAFPPGSVRAVVAPAELTASPLSISMLPDAAATEQVLIESGLLQAAPPGHCHVVMGTTGPRAVAALADAALANGVALVDAPVSGSVAAAESASLVTMVGADSEVFAWILPVLAAMTSSQFHVGPSGSGATAKLAVNLVIGAVNQALAEALLLAEGAGLGRGVLYDVLENSAAGSTYVRAKRAAFLAPDATPVAAPVSLMAKDMALVLELAREHGRVLPGASATAEALRAACAAGHDGLDMAQVLLSLRAESLIGDAVA